MQKKHYIYKYCPLIIGILLMTLMIFLKLKLNISFQNSHSYQIILKSMIIILPIIIGFYLITYKLILTDAKNKFEKHLKQLCQFQQLLSDLIIYSLFFSFLGLIISILMLFFPFILYLYYLWFLLMGVNLVYFLQIIELGFTIKYFKLRGKKVRKV